NRLGPDCRGLWSVLCQDFCHPLNLRNSGRKCRKMIPREILEILGTRPGSSFEAALFGEASTRWKGVVSLSAATHKTTFPFLTTLSRAFTRPFSERNEREWKGHLRSSGWRIEARRTALT